MVAGSMPPCLRLVAFLDMFRSLTSAFHELIGKTLQLFTLEQRTDGIKSSPPSVPVLFQHLRIVKARARQFTVETFRSTMVLERHGIVFDGTPWLQQSIGSKRPCDDPVRHRDERNPTVMMNTHHNTTNATDAHNAESSKDRGLRRVGVSVLLGSWSKEAVLEWQETSRQVPRGK